MVQLGQEVRDVVSGFIGIAVGRHEYLQGCTRITVQPPVGKDKKLPEAATFDEPQLEVVGKSKIVLAHARKDTGGPMPYKSTPPYEDKR
jgi:hypothetical protein